MLSHWQKTEIYLRIALDSSRSSELKFPTWCWLLQLCLWGRGWGADAKCLCVSVKQKAQSLLYKRFLKMGCFESEYLSSYVIPTMPVVEFKWWCFRHETRKKKISLYVRSVEEHEIVDNKSFVCLFWVPTNLLYLCCCDAPNLKFRFFMCRLYMWHPSHTCFTER